MNTSECTFDASPQIASVSWDRRAMEIVTFQANWYSESRSLRPLVPATWAWSMAELQALLDEWVVAVWQNRPHDGLRDPLAPGRALTPNERYAALIDVAGYVPVPLSPEDYIELLPASWRVINSYGVKIGLRTYDSGELNPYRRQHSGIEAENGRWEVRYDPYDISRIWIRNHHHGGHRRSPWRVGHDRPGAPPFFMDIPLGSAVFQVVIRGLLVFLTGILIGSS